MPADAAPATSAAPLAAPSFVMVGADDAGVCIDGVCALPSPPATPDRQPAANL